MALITMHNLTTDQVSEVATSGAHTLLSLLREDGVISQEVADSYEKVAIIAVEKGWLATMWEKFQGKTDETMMRFVAVRHHYDRPPKE